MEIDFMLKQEPELIIEEDESSNCWSLNQPSCSQQFDTLERAENASGSGTLFEHNEIPIRHQLKEFSNEQIFHSVMFLCEWEECNYKTINDAAFVVHVEDHLRCSPEVNGLKCCWKECTFITSDMSLLESHIHFHAYHTRIKTYGASLSTVMKLPECVKDSSGRNNLENFRITFICEWDTCRKKYLKAERFFDHVNRHVQRQFPQMKKSSKDTLTCKWTDCTQPYKRCSIALEHVRKHSTERTIGCFNCGTMFVGRLKYIDHCKRSLEYHCRQYACPECAELFATKQQVSDHRKVHEKKWACSFCTRMFPRRTALERHVRYRHTDDKPFECPVCGFRSVTHRDYLLHKEVHEFRILKCKVEGCNSTFRRERTLLQHELRKHLGQINIYMCHLCTKHYTSANVLSKHLVKFHKLVREPDYRRFQYCRDERDGKFKLSTCLSNELNDLHQISNSVVIDDSFDS